MATMGLGSRGITLAARILTDPPGSYLLNAPKVFGNVWSVLIPANLPNWYQFGLRSPVDPTSHFPYGFDVEANDPV